MLSKNIILNELEYCHVLNKKTGVIRLVEGPLRLKLFFGFFEEIVGEIKKKIILEDSEFVVILNPHDEVMISLSYGERFIKVGPCIFSLHPGEELEKQNCINNNSINNFIGKIYVLEKDKALIVKAMKDFKDDNDVERRAGEEWLIKGPIDYIPHKFVRVIKIIREISLPEHSGLYIKNKQSGKIRLEKGPKNIILEPSEELYEKEYTKSEIMAIKFEEGFDRTRAQPLWLLENEMMKFISEDTETIEYGPKVIMLGPFHRPYIMTISGGTPKGSACLKIWKIMLGPRFSTDLLDIRTKDNAVLRIKLRYKWKFNLDKENPDKIFAVSDFIGLATETIAGIIRDEAARHHFEELHSQATLIIKKAVFGDQGSYIFKQNGFEIFDIDIKEIIPKDEEIAKQMNDAIKSNMAIFVNKMEQLAKVEAERLQIEAEIELEEKKKKLLEIQHQNMKAEEMTKVSIKVDSIKSIAKAEAEAIKCRQNAEKESEVAKIKEILEAISKDNVDKYLKLQQILSLRAINKMAIVPTDSTIILPIQEVMKDFE